MRSRGGRELDRDADDQAGVGVARGGGRCPGRRCRRGIDGGRGGDRLGGGEGLSVRGLKQREEARISLAKLQEDVKIKVINPAVAGVNPVSPNKKLNVLLAILFGLIGGVGLAVGMERMKDKG